MLVSNLLHWNPSSQFPIEEDERATALLRIYRLVIDCLSCISDCPVGNHTSVDLETGGLLYCLEVRGNHDEGGREGVMLIGKLVIEKRACVEPEILTLAAKLVSCVVGCVYKRKLKDESVYRRNLQLAEQILGLLRKVETRRINMHGAHYGALIVGKYLQSKGE